MIIVKEFPDKQFENKEELFKALRENKADLIATKKMQTKHADAVSFAVPVSKLDGEVIKADDEDFTDVNQLKAELVINSTNIIDSHSDLHLNGIWKKSLKDNNTPLLLQEHISKFDHVISSEVKASVKTMTWKELGFNFLGDTQALIFSSTISKNRNEFMFDQYAKGFVQEHSVGMRYVHLELAINSESKFDKDEKKVWDKHIDKIANREVAESQGFFWAIHEAKIVEGSAVVKGSNFATPTISVEAVADTSAKEDNSTEPPRGTQDKTKVTVKGSDAKSFIKYL